MRKNQYIPLGIGLKSMIAGRYEIVGNIDGSAISKLYRAKDYQQEQEELALELFSPSVTDDPIVLSNLFQEIRAASELRHQLIVRILDIGTTSDEHCYITTEMIDGLSLETILEYLAQKGLHFDQTVYCLQQIARAVAYAHQHRLLHRDLQPSNIIVSCEGEIKVKSFGVSSLWYRQGYFSTPGDFQGNPFYCAPEEVMGKTLDERVDIYALGVIGFELLTGRVPFQGRNAKEVFERITSDCFPELLPVDPQIPNWLAQMITKATRNQAKERYQTMEELLENLDQHLSPEDLAIQKSGLGELASTVQTHQQQFLTREEIYLCPVCRARLTDAEQALIPKFIGVKRTLRCWKCNSTLYWEKGAFSKINIGLLSVFIGFTTVSMVLFGPAVASGASAFFLVSLFLLGLFLAIGGALAWTDGMQEIRIARH